MNGKRFFEEKARKSGFYLALAVCLVAVGIAAWSTYDAVHGYLSVGSREESSALQKQQEQDVLKGQEESQPVLDDDPEKPRPSASTPVEQTGGSVTVKPKTPEPETSRLESSSQPQPQESKPQEEAEEKPVPATAPLYEISGEMAYPVASQEPIKAYSAGAPVYSQTMKDWRIHTGTDLKAESGAQVMACANGQVKETYTDSMLGNVVVIEHGDYEFSYCGLGENFQVQSGDIVSKGQIIGAVTAVPSEAADEPHLHLETRRDGVCLDPRSVIEGTN